MGDYMIISLKQEFVVDSIISVHYFEYSNDYFFPGESHNFWEFLYVDKGEIEITSEGVPYKLKKGEIIFHKPNEFHSIKANGIVAPNLIVVAFSCESEAMKHFENKITFIGDVERVHLARIISEAHTAFLTPLDDPELKQIVRSVHRPFGSEQLIKMSIEALLIELTRKETSKSPQQKPTSLIKEQSQNEFVERISKYLEENVGSKITLDDICTQNITGRSHLQKIFREKTGGGVMKYFGMLKIEAARQYIREGRHNFTEIASILGYNSIHYFSRHFKKVTGMTPSEYASSVKVLTQNSKK